MKATVLISKTFWEVSTILCCYRDVYRLIAFGHRLDTIWLARCGVHLEKYGGKMLDGVFKWLDSSLVIAHFRERLLQVLWYLSESRGAWLSYDTRLCFQQQTTLGIIF